MVEFSYKNQMFQSYVAKPKDQVKGGVIVIHEVWGLTDHIKSIADRFSEVGYFAIAPDLLSETDIASHAGQLQIDLFDPQKRSQAQPKMRALMAPLQAPDFAEKAVGKLQVCFDYLRKLPEVNEKIAVCGFCFGGSYSYSLAINQPNLKAAVPFYGHAPLDVNQLKNIACPVLAFYGQQDEGLINDLPELKKLMSQAGVSYEAVVYPDCGHAFFNDTNKFTYNRSDATDAWQKTLSFLEHQLS